MFKSSEWKHTQSSGISRLFEEGPHIVDIQKTTIDILVIFLRRRERKGTRELSTLIFLSIGLEN